MAKDVRSVVQRMLLISVCSIVLVTPILNSDAHAQPLSGGTTVYGAIVERDSGRDAKLPNAVVSFLSSTGATTKVRVDENGEYSVDLPSGKGYSLTVTSRGFCPVHRPPFEAQSDRKAKFDIVLTTACPKDLVEVSGEDGSPSSIETEFCARAGIYYCEQQVTIDARSPVPIIIAFTSRSIDDGRISYDSSRAISTIAQQRSETSNHFPVLAAFGTYTVRAERVTLDFKKRTLSAQGKVSITHDDQEISVGSPCMNIRFEDQEPAAQSCD
jgi:Carboxypeptidase regulatory-like domain